MVSNQSDRKKGLREGEKNCGMEWRVNGENGYLRGEQGHVGPSDDRVRYLRVES